MGTFFAKKYTIAHSSIFKNNAMFIKQIYFGSNEYDQMLHLRNEVLRKPLGIQFTPEELSKENEDFLIAAFEDGKITGCCMLIPRNKETVQLSQMAVQQNWQGKGVGKSLINFAENLVKNIGVHSVEMEARDSAIGFYEKFGYAIQGDGYIKVNTPHHLMKKILV